MIEVFGPLNWLIVAGYIAAWFRLSSAAVDKEGRVYARWALISLGMVCFLFGIGRWLYGQGVTEEWLFMAGHAQLIFHSFLTIRTARISRENKDTLRKENDDLRSMLGDAE